MLLVIQAVSTSNNSDVANDV